MPTIFVIHEAQDGPFVEDRLIHPLPALGFDRWLSSRMLQQDVEAAPTISLAMEQSAAILVVVPASAFASQRFVAETAAALRCKTMVIGVYLGQPNVAEHDPFLHGLGRVPRIEVPEAVGRSEPRDLLSALAELLPPPAGVEPNSKPDEFATRIEWNEETFSQLLKESVNRHDYNRGEALVSAFSGHIEKRPYPYAAKHATTDLRALRKKRQFLLMRRYASAALASGTTDFEVRRQYAQALIELKDFEHAERVLIPLIEQATGAKDKEQFEARGLLARSYKQRYVDSGKNGDRRLLLQAIETYWSVFRKDKSHVWHGINAASCILRANRDGIVAPPAEDARTNSRMVLNILQRRQVEAKNEKLDVWDYATRIEALINLEQFEEALNSLKEYLVHPKMDAFEVSSTYRQFDEVLQLADDSRGAPLLRRVAEAAQRLRSGGLPQVDEGTRPMLVRVSDPQWAPAKIPNLEIHARLGTVVSISGSDRTIKALLKDPVVVAIEQSRPSGRVETTRSLPFIGVAETYQGLGGSFSESGCAALVAIIDDGIDVLHEAFLDASGQSRIVGIWDQRDNEPSASPPQGFKFGRFHTQADIASYVAQKKVPASLSKDGDHGTHVASIAAGRRAGSFAGGVAPEAQLLIVISRGNEPTGYSHAHMDALNFIKQMATELSMPVVVNLSQGMNAGAHDGKSALEVMFDDFTESGRVPGRVIVKSAGNERGKRGHAKLAVPASGADQLKWRSPPGPSRVNLELWWHSANQYQFMLTSPLGVKSDWVNGNSPDLEGYFKKHGPYRLTLVRLHIDNGDNMLKIEVTNGVSLSAASDWTLDIEALKVPAKGDIHAWIERDGGDPTEFLEHYNEEMTLSIPGTSYSVITVGAIDARRPISVGSFSSYGPTRDNREKPDISAPGVQVLAASRGSINNVVAMSGTSMAAPHVTGAVALLLSKMARTGGPIPTATQISAVLRQKTINYSGQWSPGQGYGVLDVAALLDAF
jgi:subtilisin family serine protease